MENDTIKSTVQERYGAVARGERGGRNVEGTAVQGGCCCGGPGLEELVSRQIGYTEEELAAVPEGANLGLGCGNPTAIAELREGETVIDLGAGAGFDCFLAANRVGKSGRVIGVDMTPDMVHKARRNAEKGGYENVEFRLGEVEALPVEANTADLILSNCVINLSPDKPGVFREAFRVLKPGGRAAISDIVLLAPLPESVRANAAAYTACVAGALLKDEYLGALKAAGFEQIEVASETAFSPEYFTSLADPISQGVIETIPHEDLEAATACVRGLKVTARKPAASCCCG